MKHKHHHPPQHRVGKHDNVVEVSVEEHAELHFAEYVEYGLWGDWLAYHALSGQMSADEATLEAVKQGQRNSHSVRTREDYQKFIDAGHTPEANAKRSKTMTGRKRGKYKKHKTRDLSTYARGPRKKK